MRFARSWGNGNMDKPKRQQYYKVLGKNRMPCHGGEGQWPSPRTWHEVGGELIPCQNGLHVVTKGHLVEWLGEEIWKVEVDKNEMVVCEDKIVVRRARLVKRLRNWNARTARLFAADCAETALKFLPKAQRDVCQETLRVVRWFARGKATKEELAAARAAARAAVRATWAAAEVAARTAAEAAAEAAEVDSTMAMMVAAAKKATRAAVYAAGIAAEEASGVTARVAVEEAVVAAQTKRLFFYLNKKPQRRKVVR